MSIRDVAHRVPWTRQPQFPVGVDWGNPITKGLQVAMLPASRPVDVAGNNLLTYDTGVTYQVDPTGKGFLFDGATNGVSTVGNATGAYTLFALVNPNALGGGKGVISIGTGAAYTAQIRADNADWSYYHSTSLNSDILASETGAVVVGTLTAIAGTWDGLTGINLYRGGLLRSSNTVVSSRPVAYTKVGLQWAGTIYVALFWSRALTPAEHASLGTNPWQVFLGQSRRIWTPTSSAGIPTLSASTFKPATLTSTGWTPRITAT